MNKTQKYEEDTLKVLNLLYKKFKVGDKSKYGIEAPIYWHDLTSYELTPEDFGEIAHILEKEKKIKFPVLLDEDTIDHAPFEKDVVLCQILLPSNFDEIYKSIIEEEKVNTKVKFEGGIVTYGNRRHEFHQGLNLSGDQRRRLELFQNLWDNRKHKKAHKEGKSLQSGYLAVQLNIVTERSSFDRNKEKSGQFFNLIKGINRSMREKNIPVTIIGRSVIQLIVNE